MVEKPTAIVALKPPMKPLTKKFDIHEPVFRSCATIIVGWEWERLKKWLNKYQHKDESPIDDFHKFADGIQFSIKTKSGDMSYVIYLKRFIYMAKDLGILSHELNHLIFRILTSKQIPIRDENDEVFCYLQEFYLREITKKLLK